MPELGYPARAICLVVAAGVVIGLTGCGTAKVVNGAHKPPPDTRHHARLTIARRIADPAAWAKNQARTLARRMLARQAIPAGARPLRAGQHVPWALQLGENINDPGHSVRLGRVYLVPSPESAVIGFLRSHFPSGSAEAGFGTGGTDPEQSMTYTQAVMPDGVSGTLFFVGVLPAGPGRTWLRVDAMVDWCLPRTPAEHIDPAKYRAVVLTGFRLASRGTKIRRFTAPSVITELARGLNAMHTVGDGYSCPVFTGGDQLTFEPKAGQAPVVTVREGPCAILAVTVGGQKQPALGFAYHVLGVANRLLGIG